MCQVRIFFLLPLVGICSLCEIMFFFSKSANNFQGNQKHCVKVPGLSVSIILVIFPPYTILKKICVYIYMVKEVKWCMQIRPHLDRRL